ncbi:MAG TPA: SPASM domain-containing protein [Anaerolineales bacterium]|nr:SPASM domain-containing protein [Anaerolineales bacterium]
MNTDFLKTLLFPRPRSVPEPIKPGLHHYLRENQGQYTRFHLRVEMDGSGMLLANATAAAYLSPAGVIIVKGLIEKQEEANIQRELRARFSGVTSEQIQKDFTKVRVLLHELASPGDNYPILNLDDATHPAFNAPLLAPLEAMLPLDEPKKIIPLLNRLWEVAIPHVTLLVPEAPNPDFLTHAVERAEDLGMICGVSGRATDLVRGNLIENLVMAGLDHVTVFYASAQSDIHDELFGDGDHLAARQVFTRTQQLEVADVAHIPLVQTTLPGLKETLESLHTLNVPNAAFFAITSSAESSDGFIPAEGMRQVAAQVEEETAEANVRYLWEPPVQRNPAKSLSGQVREGPRCPTDLSIRVETNGVVIPPRGPYRMAGNILKDDWDSIWLTDAFQQYRTRLQSPTRCDHCPGLAICAADCPADERGWSCEN